MIRAKEALAYHAGGRPGKVEVKPSKSVLGPRELRLAYLPGAVHPAAEIAEDRSAAWRLTAKGNLVAVVTNGTALPGLGDVGPTAAKPLQEGMAVLLKRLADIDVFDLELDARDPWRFIETVQALEPTFGAVNLRDIRAPDGLAIYEQLRDSLAIPVFHENLYGTAVVAIAAVINALALADKRVDEVRVVVCGAGTVGLGCARLLVELGVRRDNLLLYDRYGLVHPSRGDLNVYQAAFARDAEEAALAEGLRDADVFLGASTGGVLTQEMVRSMARYPVVLAMATPEPEINYPEARAARRDVLVATSVSEQPNAILGLLATPYILRGALDVRARRITDRMKLAAARALADLAREDVVDEVSRAYGYETFTFGPEYLLPKPVDPRIFTQESVAVARQAALDGVARREVEPTAYQESLAIRLGTGREMMRRLILKARTVAPRIALSDATDDDILRACAIMVDDGIATPILIGRTAEIDAAVERIGLDLSGVSVIDPVLSPSLDAYAEGYFQLRARRGVTREVALRRLTDPRWFAAMMLHSGDADVMLSGSTSTYADSIRPVLEVIGPARSVRRVSSLHMALRPGQVFFLSDCAVNVDPDAEVLAEIALLSARAVRSLGIEPRVAMLTFSDFGSADHPFTRKVRRATHIVRERAPDLIVEGEIQLNTALNAHIRTRYFPFCELPADANVLVFPDVQSGNLALHMLRNLGSSVVVGPLLLGTRLPVHLLEIGAAVQDVVNLAALAAVQAGPPMK